MNNMNNLKAEMARKGIKKRDIQNLLGCSYRTVTNKLDGKSDFTLLEAVKIKNYYFKNLNLEYLFAVDEKTA
ncbi:MAG: XRE family transcriptional regulator [Acutalibacteraceae bacterium]